MAYSLNVIKTNKSKKYGLSFPTKAAKPLNFATKFSGGSQIQK